MPQSPLNYNTKNQSGALVPAQADASGISELVTTGGLKSALNVTAAAVIKATAGRCVRIVVIAPGSAGSLTLNDCATTGAATTANEIYTIGYAALSAGQVINLDWPCATGVVVSAVPSAGSPQFVLSYT